MAEAKTARQPERDYSHRDVVDKLGIKPGFARGLRRGARAESTPTCARACSGARWPRRGRRTTSRWTWCWSAPTPRPTSAAVLERWRQRIDQAGGIWLLTPKRGQPGYVDQRELILAGPAAGVVDNKICSVSDTLSAMRFVIRKADRVYS